MSNQNSLENARALAEDLAQKYNPKGLAPFPYQKITEENKDLEVYFSDKLDVAISGAITFLKEDQKFIIIVNKNKPETRINFTIAHEIGHYFLHKEAVINTQTHVDTEGVLESGSLFSQENTVPTELEKEANNFAASLLMPRKLLIETWVRLKNPKKCAEIFKVSEVAMTIRLDKLDLLD